MIKNIRIKYFKSLEDVKILNAGVVNIFVGKNNAGKSSILHAIDMWGLPVISGDWNIFQPKLDIKDMFWESGPFSIEVEHITGSKVEVRSLGNEQRSPQVIPNSAPEELKLKTLLVQSDLSGGLTNRQHKTPQNIMNYIQNRNYGHVNSLDVLFAIRFYAERNERGLTPEIYQNLISEIQNYFPDIKKIESGRTEADVATLTYFEFDKKLDILYSGTGLKHFIDILVKITISEAKIVLLDEPESGLHPDLQRRFFKYISQLAKDKNIQFFISTHSHVVFSMSEDVNFYRVVNFKGKREVHLVNEEARHTLLGDFGIRPSDIFNSDICIMVEGATDVIYFEHVLRTIYHADFDPISVSIVQFGGGAAHGIVSGVIKVENIVPARKYTYWIHDRDSLPGAHPSTETTKFKNQIEKAGLPIHVWEKREIEYYFPLCLVEEAQQNDHAKIKRATNALTGTQNKKFREHAEDENFVAPQGVYLKRLLKKHVTQKEHLPLEVQKIMEGLIEWKKEIIG